MLLISYVEMNDSRRGDVWFLDFGCSNHMCGDKRLFCDLNKGFRQKIKLGNNTGMDVLGKGNVRLKVNDFTHVVSEVFFMLELKNNILSIGQLQQKGPQKVYSHIEAHFISEEFEKCYSEHTLFIKANKGAKRILRYLKGTIRLGVFYKKRGCGGLIGYTDSNYAGDLEDRKSTSGYVFMLGSGAIAWSSRKQPIVTLSTTEAEFVAAAACASQAIWMKRILEKLSLEESKCTTIRCDNSSTIKLSKNPLLHGRSKHIDVRFHFLCDLTREGTIELLYCGTEDQLADVMTKSLTLDAFQRFRSQLGVYQVPELN
ncbi:Retrovirus-related Pol polyprotein from transposon TNT 1-94 [Melia azedarach]|uniref:Retrovirus-related Pol polyprotein from transposon TNT 1-94 n=1 Tax=Melia azedarach TaxID=155640 RepID=A0ACC1XFX1_MELAZ|nr:Retrovirus-related Pol polyprotein from transposon TNT 1-94 [Melia azedarach]